MIIFNFRKNDVAIKKKLRALETEEDELERELLIINRNNSDRNDVTTSSRKLYHFQGLLRHRIHGR